MRYFLTLAALLISTVALSQETVGLEQIGESILNLIRDFKTLGTLGVISAVITIIIQFFKSNLCGNWWGDKSSYVKRFVIVLLGQVVAIIGMVMTGSSWLAAVIAGLISSGGAVVIYEALKPLLKKK